MLENAPLTIALAAILALGATAAPEAADRKRDRVERPAVPANLEVDDEFQPYFVGHAEGTQNWLCLPTTTGVGWTLFGPQATLFDDEMDQVMTHYLSPNPQQGGTPRATWRHSRDTSTVWAVAVETSIDAAYVAPGAIPWLKLQVVGAQYGPDWGHKLTATKFIQRVNTSGGVAPATGCSLPEHLGKRELVAYTTDYVFYR